MKTQEVEFDGDLWFLTKVRTDKFTQLKQYLTLRVLHGGILTLRFELAGLGQDDGIVSILLGYYVIYMRRLLSIKTVVRLLRVSTSI
ncbi:pyridoxamine 5'-phosphate oxidase family protein [Paenibacillus sp. MBLB2552]|uniref:Pyridoxamine 5'-phosphate oxidase family protein n=2 Tax=Paenibacillus mellifer TaxID=2937794 RepID=A0A9X1Y330_9BACL|nr:pyridoxamine 5'-phosphate oxidase family protein [Paenibacillus mellifer]